MFHNEWTKGSKIYIFLKSSFINRSPDFNVALFKHLNINKSRVQLTLFMVSAYGVHIYISYLTSDEESHTVPYCPNIHGITTTRWQARALAGNLSGITLELDVASPLYTWESSKLLMPQLAALHLGADLLVWCRMLQPGPVGTGASSSFWWKNWDLCVLEAS